MLIYFVKLSLAAGSGDKPDTLDLSGNGNAVLGAGTSDGAPLFFTANNGLLTVVSPNAQQLEHDLSK